jgi:hypothetical protein
MPNYKKVQPVIQSGWYTCWAAAMSWWTHAMQDRGRAVMGEQDMLDEFPYSWDKNGAMTISGMSTIFNTKKFLMKCRFSGEKDFDRIIYNLSDDAVKAFDAFPIVVGYNDPNAGGNHIAVICEFDSTDVTYQKFVVMDPARGYRVRSRNYLASQSMIFAWAQEAGDIIYG